MGLTPSSRLSGYMNNFRSQNTKMTDYFYTEYMSNNFSKQFHIEENVLQHYKRFLSRTVKRKEFTDEEFLKYRCNPWYVSDDLYGTTQLWFLLLHLNEMYSATEFTKRSIKIYDPDLIIPKLSEIIAVNEEYFKANRAEVFLKKRDIEEGIDGMWD